MVSDKKEQDSARVLKEVPVALATPVADGHIIVDRTRCSGCKTCELVCALAHGNEVSPCRARIHVTYNIWDLNEHLICQQCPDPVCLRVCATDSIYIDEKTGARIIDEEKCAGCKQCFDNCPWQAITYDPVNQVCIKCDLCGGDPECVKNCLFKALQYVPYKLKGSSLFGVSKPGVGKARNEASQGSGR